MNGLCCKSYLTVVNPDRGNSRTAVKTRLTFAHRQRTIYQLMVKKENQKRLNLYFG